MKLLLLLLSFDFLALAAPAPAPHSGHGNTMDYYRAEYLGALTETPGSGARFGVLMAGDDDPRNHHNLQAEVDNSQSNALNTSKNPPLKVFPSKLFEICVSKVRAISGENFDPNIELRVSGAIRGRWGLKRISQAGKVDVGTRDLRGLDFASYVFHGAASGLGKDVNIYILDTGIK